MKTLLTVVLALTVAGFAQQPGTMGSTGSTGQTAQPGQAGAPGQTAQSGQAAGQPGGQPAQKKEIKDSAEYNAYVAALRETNPAQKATLMESFVTQYPNSVVKEDALEQLMAAYEQSGNAAKTIDAANRLLQVNPNNIRALALLAYNARSMAEQGQNMQQNVAQARQTGERGIQALQTATKPEGMSDADWDKLKLQTQIIFEGALGFAALQGKDYPTAQQHLQAAVDARAKTNPNDPTNLRDIYPLALAYLEANPINPKGLWYVARAANLSNQNPQIVKYGVYKYTKYHGSQDGWDQLLAQAKTSPEPPADFAVAPAPSPADQARQIASSTDPTKMDFGQWELVLSEGDPATQEKVFSAIKGTEVPFAAKVISATKTTLSLAATADAIQNNQADVEVTMAAPLTTALMPKPGSEIQLQAKPDSYTPKPFLMKMVNGQLIVKAAPKTPARRTPARRKG
ncbi:MAG: hypothetical protein JO187_03450 [Acidobacteria bacterium]|nr:hypothetical protein [Acidobacteriota bacterium]